MKFHRLGVIGVERQVERIGSATSTLISESAQAIWRAHERELNVELFVVAGVEIDGLTAILVFTKFRKVYRRSSEIG
jgi:hypothetical protein|tara:strand:+ start:460 stop:690 length:231 start_codon:yes stop_codon:yes gene_type:complete